MNVAPYLNFNGNCEEAFQTYARIFGGKAPVVFYYGDSPMSQKYPQMARQAMHARVDIGDQMILGSDTPPEYFEKAQGTSVCVEVEDVEKAERIFAELAEGANVKMPIQETFWAKRYGQLVDRFGTPWMINVSQQAYAAA